MFHPKLQSPFHLALTVRIFLFIWIKKKKKKKYNIKCTLYEIYKNTITLFYKKKKVIITKKTKTKLAGHGSGQRLAMVCFFFLTGLSETT